MSHHSERTYRRWIAAACVLPLASLVAFSGLSLVSAVTPLASATLTAHCDTHDVAEPSYWTVSIDSSAGGQQTGTVFVFPPGSKLSFQAGDNDFQGGGSPPAGVPISYSPKISITVKPSGFTYSGPQPGGVNKSIPGPTLPAGTYTVTFSSDGWTRVNSCVPTPPRGYSPPNYTFTGSSVTYTVIMSSSGNALAMAKADALKATFEVGSAKSEAALLKTALGSAGLTGSVKTDAMTDATNAENDANASGNEDGVAAGDIGQGDTSGVEPALTTAETDANNASTEFGNVVTMMTQRGGSHDAQVDATTGQSDAQAASSADASGLAMISVRGGSHD